MAQPQEAGFSRAVPWVVPGNDRARRFYEGADWRSDNADRRQIVHGVEISEVRYSRTW